MAKGKSAVNPAAESKGSSSATAVPAPYIQKGVPTQVNTNAGAGLVMLGYSLGEPIGHISSMSKVSCVLCSSMACCVSSFKHRYFF